ncbi:MAG: hypothetical protein E6I32_16435 [Chloroflexi bacterium]|nr:MAG: hypothetical protein E6I32_16435 [Chloroflexota bacterium]
MDFQGDREGRPYNTQLPVLHVPVYCTGDPRGRPDRPGGRPDRPGGRPDRPGSRPDRPGSRRGRPGQHGTIGLPSNYLWNIQL